MADIRVKDLPEATTPGADYYFLSDSAADGPRKIKPSNSVTKADIGLGNVNNTADLDKPISTATQTALDGKATAAQGAKADSAVQPGSLGGLAYKNKAAISDINTVGTPNTTTWLRGDGVWATPAGGGDMVASVYDPDTIGLNAFGKGLPLRLQSDIASTTIPVPVQYIRTSGYGAVGVGAATYKRVGSQPSHPGKAQSADGAWWEISEPELNPFMFGAIGDGTGSGGGTNDATALQNALSAAGALKRPLRLLPGTYRCDSALTIPAGVQIDAIDVFLDFTNLGSNQAALSFANGGRIRGATIKGPGSATFISGSRGIQCSGTFNSGAAPTFVNAPIVEGCEIYGFAEYGVYLAYVNGGEYRYNNIHDVGYAGIGGVSCNRTKVSGNTITNITSTGGSGDHYGIFLDRNDGTSETSDPRSQYCDISYNYVSNIDWEGIDTHGGAYFTIFGNIILNCGRGIALTRSNISGVSQLAPQYCTVHGNIVVNTNASSKEGISVIGAINGSTVNQYATSCVVTGNVIYGHGTNGGTVGGFYAYATTGLVVSGNSFYQCKQNSISLNFANYAFSITGNTHKDPYSGSSGAACIYVYDINNQGFIGNETFWKVSAISSFTGDFSLYVATTSGTNITVGKCSFIGIDASHLRFGGAGLSACDVSQAWSASGRTTISSVSGASSNNANVAFGKIAPTDSIRVQTSLASTYYGTKIPIFRTASQVSTGFTIVAYPAAGGNWDASGDLLVDWNVTL